MKQSAESCHLFLDNDTALSGASTSYTTFQIDFAALAGDMYYNPKYTKYKIILNAYSAWTNQNTVKSGYDRTSTVRMRGFEWYNSSYGINTQTSLSTTNNVIMSGNNTEAAFPGWVVIPSVGIANSTFNGQVNGLIFNKPSNPQINLEIFFRDFRANAAIATDTGYEWSYSLSFTIYGLYD